MTGMVAELDSVLTADAPFMRNIVERARRRFGPSWEEAFDAMLAIDLCDSIALRAAVAGYVRFSLESLRLQKQFERTGQYTLTKFEDAASAVYLNGSYMLECYLPGLLLSQYLWPHHYLVQQFFHSNFVKSLPEDSNFSEIGIGTGFFTTELLTALPRATGTAFDLSPHSLKFASARVSARNASERWQGRQQDVIAFPPVGNWPVVICVEVLEHLEEPRALMRSIRSMLTPGGRGFITAALTAAHTDHIYLYRTADEVLAQARDAGLVVADWIENAAYPASPGVPVPRIVAMVVL
jgi:SAM-dependent methyltransferase